MRPTHETGITQHVVGDDDTQGLATMADAVNYLAAEAQLINENAVVVARQIGYDGALTIGALEDEIRFYQRRSVEACVDLGKRLLLLKELTAHGEFGGRLELLGIPPRTAQRFMKAALKVSKNDKLSHLTNQVAHQSKFLELLILDDEELDVLQQGQSVRGITLDKIDTMSHSELKKALRDSQATAEAKDAVIKSKSELLNQREEELAALQAKKRTERPVSAEQKLIDLRSSLQIIAADVKTNVMTRLAGAVKDLCEYSDHEKQFASVCLIEIGRELSLLRDEWQLSALIDETPLSSDVWAMVNQDSE